MKCAFDHYDGDRPFLVSNDTDLKPGTEIRIIVMIMNF